jgi:hypothetical protein
MVTDTSAKCKTTYSNICRLSGISCGCETYGGQHSTYSSTNDGQIVGCQVIINLLPPVARADSNKCPICRKPFLVHVDHIDSDATLDTRSARKGCMTSALMAKGHCVRRAIRTRLETSRAAVGVNVQ